MNMKKVLAYIFICAMVTLSPLPALADAAKYADLKPMTLLFPHTSPKTEANAQMADLIKQYIEEETGGKLTIEVMPAAQLGTAQETAQQLQDGSVHMSSEQVYSMVDFIPEVSVFDMMFLFSTYSGETIDKTINAGPLHEYLQDKYHNSGFQLLGYAQGATFRETTSNKELRTPQDYRGLKIRTLPSNNFVVGWQALGTSPTPITIGELYLALQQNLVESQENPYDIVLSNNFNEVQKYLCASHHNIYIMHIVMNKKFYDSLPQEYRDAIEYGVRRARTEISAAMPQIAEESREELLNRGMQFIEYTEEDFAQFREMAKPQWDSLRKIAGDTVVDMMIQELEKNK